MAYSYANPSNICNACARKLSQKQKQIPMQNALSQKQKQVRMPIRPTSVSAVNVLMQLYKISENSAGA